MTSTSVSWHLGAAKETIGGTTQWSGKYCPMLHVSTDIMGLNEVRFWLKTKRAMFRELDNIIPKCAVQFRHSIPIYLGEGASEIDENFMLVFPLEENLHRFQAELSFMNNLQTDHATTLTAWIEGVQHESPGIKFTLLIQGLEAYLSKIPKEELAMIDNHVLAGGVTEDIGRLNGYLSGLEIKNILARLQLTANINYRFYESPKELAQLLKEYALAIGEAIANEPGEHSFHKRVELSDIAEVEFGYILGQCLPDKPAQAEACRVIRRGIAYELSTVYKCAEELINTCKDLSDAERETLFADIEIEYSGRTYTLGPIVSGNLFSFCKSYEPEYSREPDIVIESESSDNGDEAGAGEEIRGEVRAMDNGNDPWEEMESEREIKDEGAKEEEEDDDDDNGSVVIDQEPQEQIQPEAEDDEEGEQGE